LGCVGFLCPRAGGKPIDFDTCLKTCDERCMSRRTTLIFQEYNKDRGLKHFSITQLISPTRVQWLMATHSYCEPSEDMIARTIGSLGHAASEINDKDIVSEKRLEMEIEKDVFVSGAFDSYEKDEIWDLKICGFYKIKMGIADVKNLHDWTIQLNFYRMLAEKEYKKKVNHMFIEAWAREPRSVCERGKTPQQHVFKIPRLSDWLVLRYVQIKYRRLSKALDNNWCEKGKPREMWGGRRCNYCAVRKVCEAIEEAHNE